MKIIFSRHAKRRAKLYKIPEDLIRDVISEKNLPDGKHELIEKLSVVEYPVKIIVVIEMEVGTVVTNYPLKKGNEL